MKGRLETRVTGRPLKKTLNSRNVMLNPVLNLFQHLDTVTLESR